MGDKKRDPLRALILITDDELADKAVSFFYHNNIPLQYVINAEGTAPSEILNILGLGNSEKRLVVATLPKVIADAMIVKLYQKFNLGVPGSGIAFTLPLTGINLQFLNMLNSLERGENGGKEEWNMSDIKHSLIAAIVNQGFSEDVMEAARSAGASGGTVVHGRRVAGEKVVNTWGLSLQDERELVFILVKNETKLEVMQAIGDKCGMHSEAKGLVISMPVDNVIGLRIFD